MSRALLCSVLLLSVSCSSSSDRHFGDGLGGSGSTPAGSTGGTSSSLGGGSNSNVGGSVSASLGGSTASGATGGSGATPVGGSASTGGSTAAGGSAATSGGTTGVAGSAGAGGNAGGATGGAAGSAGTGPATATASVTQWGGDNAHTAHFVHPSLTTANMAKMAADTYPVPAGGAEYFSKFAGQVAATPLYLAGATPGSGEYIIATTENNVYAFNETTGALVFKHNIGGFLANPALSVCGVSMDHGIVSTPAIDATARVIYVAAAMTDGHHEIHALSADTGAEVAGWPVDVSKLSSGGLAFPSAAQNQRSALSLVNGIVYVAFGGYCGDQGNYHGWVVAVNSKDPTKTGAWATMDTRQAGIWAPGGMASDGNGVFAVTGNVAGGSTDHTKTDSEELIRITGLAVPNRDSKNMFFPSEWINPMNSNDMDFGSSSPAVITVPNSTPSTVIVAPAKPGRVYFLDATNLGASLGQFADLVVAGTNLVQSVYTGPSAYSTPAGVHVAITTGLGSACPSPVGVNDGSVMSILMQPGATPAAAPTPKILWCAKVGTDAATVMRSPISTNSSGIADAIVWLLNGSSLNGFDGTTGAVLFSGGTGTCGGVHPFTTLIAANGHLVAAGDAAGQAHLCSWSVHN